jgi:hypothetical protein
VRRKSLRSNSRGKTRFEVLVDRWTPPMVRLLSIYYDGWNRRFLSSFEKLALT